MTAEKKPRVGVVGEILVKFLPAANNYVVDLLEAEGAEAVVPDLTDFLLKMLIIIIINVVPMVISYIDTANQPLYAFIWSFFGFGLLAAIGATLLWPEFKPFISNENVSKSDADSEA